MATKIEVGGTYKAARVRSGESSYGKWQLVAYKPEGRGHREMTIYVQNGPIALEDGDTFRVDDIMEVASKAKKDNMGNWNRTETVVKAILSKVETPKELEPYADFTDDYELNLDLFL